MSWGQRLGQMPTFCRHNRFIERCPICSKTLPEYAGGGERSSRGSAATRSPGRRAAPAGRSRGEAVHVQRESRAQDDGYRTALLPGVRASADAARLGEEIAFASARLHALRTAPPGLYAEASALAGEDLEKATWMCFLISYLAPLDVSPDSPPDEDAFAGIRLALRADGDGPDDLDGVLLGPRTSHGPARGADTLRAYRHWVERAGTQTDAFRGDPAWSPRRRFERLFERLALPGFGRMGRYDLLVTLGCLELYELEADSLHLLGARGQSSSDLTTVAAKRLFAIGDPMYLERRAAALAEATAVPLETLDLALANWAAPRRATLGMAEDARDHDALARARDALGL